MSEQRGHCWLPLSSPCASSSSKSSGLFSLPRLPSPELIPQDCHLSCPPGLSLDRDCFRKGRETCPVLCHPTQKSSPGGLASGKVLFFPREDQEPRLASFSSQHGSGRKPYLLGSGLPGGTSWKQYDRREGPFRAGVRGWLRDPSRRVNASSWAVEERLEIGRWRWEVSVQTCPVESHWWTKMRLSSEETGGRMWGWRMEDVTVHSKVRSFC